MGFSRQEYWSGVPLPSLSQVVLVIKKKKKKKRLPMQEMQETQVGFLGQENHLEEGMATHSGILAWRIPWTEEPGRL